MNTRNIFWAGKGGWCVGLTTLLPSCSECHENCESQPPGTIRACTGLYRDCFTFTYGVIKGSFCRQDKYRIL